MAIFYPKFLGMSENDHKFQFAEDAEVGTASLESGVPSGWMGLDVGPKSNETFAQVIGQAKTIVWNGPAGKLILLKMNKVFIKKALC